MQGEQLLAFGSNAGVTPKMKGKDEGPSACSFPSCHDSPLFPAPVLTSDFVPVPPSRDAEGIFPAAPAYFYFERTSAHIHTCATFSGLSTLVWGGGSTLMMLMALYSGITLVEAQGTGWNAED